jgi:hypothetical protein
MQAPLNFILYMIPWAVVYLNIFVSVMRFLHGRSLKFCLADSLDKKVLKNGNSSGMAPLFGIHEININRRPFDAFQN